MMINTVKSLYLEQTLTQKIPTQLALQELERDAKDTRHEKVYLSDINFEQEDDYIVLTTPDWEAYLVRDYSVSQALGRLGWGHRRAFDTLPTDIQLDILKHFQEKKVEDKPKSKWYVPYFERQFPVVKAILSEIYQYIGTYTLDQRIRDAIEEAELDYTPKECFHSSTMTRIRYLSEDIRQPVSPDDIIQCGFQFQNSETGHSSISISLLTYRALCANMAHFGYGSEDVTDKIRHAWISPRKVEREMIDAVLNIEDRFKEITPLLQKATEIEVPVRYLTKGRITRQWSGRPHTDYETILGQFKVTRKAIDQVIASYQLEQGNTLWHSLNAINFASAMKNVSDDEELELQKIFGDLVMELDGMQILEYVPLAQSNAQPIQQPLQVVEVPIEEEYEEDEEDSSDYLDF